MNFNKPAPVGCYIKWLADKQQECELLTKALREERDAHFQTKIKLAAASSPQLQASLNDPARRKAWEFLRVKV